MTFLTRSEYDALKTKYLETNAEKEKLQLQYNSKAEFQDLPTRVRRIRVSGLLIILCTISYGAPKWNSTIIRTRRTLQLPLVRESEVQTEEVFQIDKYSQTDTLEIINSETRATIKEMYDMEVQTNPVSPNYEIGYVEEPIQKEDFVPQLNVLLPQEMVLKSQHAPIKLKFNIAYKCNTRSSLFYRN